MKETKRLHKLNIKWENSYPEEHRSTEAELDYWECKGNNHHLPHGNCRGYFTVSDKSETQPDRQGSTLMKQGIPIFEKVQRQHIN